jgi:serine O-acetyltransferase
MNFIKYSNIKKMTSTISLIKNDFRSHIAYNRLNKRNNSRLNRYGLFFSLFLIDTGFRGIIFYRICHSSCQYSRARLYIAYFFFKLLSSIEISPRADIGPGLFLPHPQCVVIGMATMGENCTVFQGVTIGAKLPFHNKYPKIGDNVYIGAGSTILGDIEIGNNVTVGAKTLILDDVPDNCVIVGNPARILSRKHKKNRS